MHRVIHVTALLALLACGACGCSRKSADTSSVDTRESAGGQLMRLSCASTTYRVRADQVDSDVNDACGRVKKSAEALRAYRATIARFTCQEGDGHIVLSVLAPRDQFDDYDKNCQQYLTAKEAFRNHTSDFAAHQSASREFTTRNNELVRKRSEEDNALFHQRQADQASLNTLIRNRGGSIEITN
jgi:hypothetical protein